MDFGVAAYSFPFGCGFLPRDGQGPAQPLDAFGLAELASRHNLAGVETPLYRMLPGLSTAAALQLRDTLESRGLSLVVDTGVVEEGALREVLPLAALAGARVVRAMLSTVLEGARAGVPGGWDVYLGEMGRRIARVLPLLEEHDLVLALENHQDASSRELVALCEGLGPHVGVTLDVANPLAVGEDPLEFARTVAPWVRNAHLKDYKVYHTRSGYRLVRCALGEGVVPLPEIIALLRDAAPGATLHVELAALHARHIRLLEDGWWEGYPPRDVRDVLPALRLVARHAQSPDEGWETPWEGEAPAGEIERYEREQFEASVRYLRTIGGG